MACEHLQPSFKNTNPQQGLQKPFTWQIQGLSLFIIRFEFAGLHFGLRGFSVRCMNALLIQSPYPSPGSKIDACWRRIGIEVVTVVLSSWAMLMPKAAGAAWARQQTDCCGRTTKRLRCGCRWKTEKALFKKKRPVPNVNEISPKVNKNFAHKEQTFVQNKQDLPKK